MVKTLPSHVASSLTHMLISRMLHRSLWAGYKSAACHVIKLLAVHAGACIPDSSDVRLAVARKRPLLRMALAGRAIAEERAVIVALGTAATTACVGKVCAKSKLSSNLMQAIRSVTCGSSCSKKASGLHQPSTLANGRP
jgi:hypothetical protein